jgi:hypothetical protein
MSLKSQCNRHTVQVQEERSTVSGALGVHKEWVTVRTDTCTVNPLSGSRRAVEAQLGYKMSHRLYFDHDPQVGVTNRFVWQDRILSFIDTHDVGGQGRLWQVDTLFTTWLPSST